MLCGRLRGTGQCLLNCLQQGLHANRFSKHLNGPKFSRSRQEILVSRFSGNRQDLDPRKITPDGHDDLKTIAIRHVNIGENHVKPGLSQVMKSFSPLGGFDH